MSSLRERLSAAGTADQLSEVLREELVVERVSMASFDARGEAFRIEGCSGKQLLERRMAVPTALATQMLVPSSGSAFNEPDFATRDDWDRPVDHLTLGVGFRCGCSLPLGPSDAPVGAVSLSSTGSGRSFDRMMDVLTDVGDVLTARLVCPDPAAVAAVELTRREADVLLDLDDGLRFKQIALARGITETTAKGYARSLFRKLDAHSRTEAVNAARGTGLLQSLRRARR